MKGGYKVLEMGVKRSTNDCIIVYNFNTINEVINFKSILGELLKYSSIAGAVGVWKIKNVKNESKTKSRKANKQ